MILDVNISNNLPLVWYSMILDVNISNNSLLEWYSLVLAVDISNNLPLSIYSMILDVKCIGKGYHKCSMSRSESILLWLS